MTIEWKSLVLILALILASVDAKPLPGLLGDYPPEKAGCFIAGDMRIS